MVPNAPYVPSPCRHRGAMKSLPGKRTDPAGSATALRDSIFAATHGLADLKAFELRMVEVQRLVLPSVTMGKTECFRLGPGFERRLALPCRV